MKNVTKVICIVVCIVAVFVITKNCAMTKNNASAITKNNTNPEQLFDAVKAGKIRVVDSLIRQGVDVNSVDEEHMTPLMYAVKEHNNALAKHLIKKGADVNANTAGKQQMVQGETALMMAAKNGFIDVIQTLIDAGANVNAVAWSDSPSAGEPVLSYAIDSGVSEGVRILLKKGASPDAVTTNPIFNERPNSSVRNLPLLSAAINVKAPIAIIEELIRGGADVNKKSSSVEWTPLMVAAYVGYADAVKRLLDAGADTTLKNTQDGGRTALDYAKEGDYKKIIMMLKEK